MKSRIIYKYLIFFATFSIIACKQDFKDKVWVGDRAILQITDSIAFFTNNGMSNDYLYKIKDDTLILSTGLCSILDQKYQIKLYKDQLTLTGFKRYEDSKIDTYNLNLAKDQNQNVGIKWMTSAKILSKSYQCEINGSWYDSLTNTILVFDEENCYVGQQFDTLHSFLLIKGPYVCYDNNSFFIKNSCTGIRFMIKNRNDTLMNWYEEEFEDQSISKNYIYRVNDIEIDTSKISQPILGRRTIRIEDINLKPKGK